MFNLNLTNIKSKCAQLKKYKGLLRLVVSVLMLALVFHAVDFTRLKNTLVSIPIWVVCLVVLGYVSGPLLNCYRWMLFAQSGGVQTSYPRAIRAYFIGAFVNAFGLGTVGGDLTRALVLVGTQPQKAVALASVAADRLHGLAVLAMVGSVSALVFGHEHMSASLLLALGCLGPTIVICWILGPWVVSKLCPPDNKLRAKLEEMSQAFPRKASTLLLVTGLSVLFHLFQISLHALMAYGVGAHIPWRSLLVVVPFVNIVSTLPISWQGLGIRENAYLFFLAPMFLSPEQCVAFGMMWLLSVTAASAVGGILSVAKSI